MKKLATAIVISSALVLTGCQTKPPADAFQLSESSLESRQIQSRIFNTSDETALLSSGVGVLQDMGFTLDESEKTAGLITASKTVDATDGGQVAAAVFVALLGGGNMAIDKEQKIKVSFVTYPARTATGFVARASFQRIVWNTQGIVSRAETLTDAELYQEFFDKLSKSVFLEAQSI